MGATEVRAKGIPEGEVRDPFSDTELIAGKREVTGDVNSSIRIASIAVALLVPALTAAIILWGKDDRVRAAVVAVLVCALLTAAGWFFLRKRGRAAWLVIPSFSRLRARAGNKSAAPDADPRAGGNTNFEFASIRGQAAAAPKSVVDTDSYAAAVQSQLDAADSAAADVLSAHTRVFAERLGREQRKLTEALELYGDSIASRLNVAGVALAREFRDNGDELNRRIEAIGDAVVASIGRQGASTASLIETSTLDAERRLNERSKEVISSIESISATSARAIAGAAENTVELFERKQQELSERAEALLSRHLEKTEEYRHAVEKVINTGGSDFSERAATAVNAIERKFQDASVSLDMFVDDALGRIEARISARLEDLERRLSQVDSDLDQRWAHRRQGVVAEFASAAGEAHSTVAEQVRRAAAEAAEQTSQVLLAHQSEVVARLADLDNMLTDRTTQVVEQVAFQTTALRSALEAAEATATRENDRFAMVAESATQTIESSIGKRFDEAGARLDALQNAWNLRFDSQIKSIDERALAESARFEALTEGHRAALQTAVIEQRALLETDLSATAKFLQMHFAERKNEIARSIELTTQDLTQNLLREVAGVLDTLGSRGELLRDQILSRQAELISAIETGVSQTESGMNDSLRKAMGQIDDIISRIETSLEQRTQFAAQTLAERADNFIRTVQHGEREIQLAAEKITAESANTLEAGRRTLVDAVTATALQTASALDERILSATKRLEIASDSLAEAVAAGAAAAETVLSEQRLRITGALAASAADAVQTVNASREQLVSALASGTRETAEWLEQRARSAGQTLEAQTQAIAAVLDSGRALLAGEASRTADELAVVFSERLQELQTLMADGASKIRLELSEPLVETLARIETEGSQLAAATRALAESFASTSALHRDRMHQYFAEEADALTEMVTSNAEAFRRNFESIVADADSVFISRGLDVTRELATRINELRSLLEDNGVQLVKALEARGDLISQQIDNVSQRSIGDFDRKTTGLIALLTRRGDDLLSAMTAAASESTRGVASASEELEAGKRRAETSLREVERKIGAMLASVNESNFDHLLKKQLPRIASEPGAPSNAEVGGFRSAQVEQSPAEGGRPSIRS